MTPFLLLTIFANAQDNNTTCTLCADGSTPPVDLNAVVFQKLVEGVNYTCADLMDQASAIDDPSSEQCAKMQREGQALCECPATTDAADVCTLCYGAAEFDPSIMFVQDWPCSTISTYVSGDTRENACWAYQSTIGLYCACPYDPSVAAGDVPPVCRLCGAGNLLPEPGRFVVDPVLQDKKVCSDLEFESTRVYATCEDVKARYAKACCEPTPEGAPTLGDIAVVEGGSDVSSNSTSGEDDKDGDVEEEDTTSSATCAPLKRICYVIVGIAASLLPLTLP